MRYLITLTPLEPFFFGGDITFGKFKKLFAKLKKIKFTSSPKVLTLRDFEYHRIEFYKKSKDENNSSYLVQSRYFPQQSAILGMIRKEMLIQKGYLTTKRKGEWIDKSLKEEAKKFIGDSKFEFDTKQDFGVFKNISPIFLLRGDKKFIKKVAIDKYSDGLLEGYNPKEDIYNNFIPIDNGKPLKTEDIFKEVKQIGNSKNDKEDSLFKKTSYILKDNFKFAFYIESDFELKDAFINLGGEKSTFQMSIIKTDDTLEYRDKNGYLTLLSDAYIDIDIRDNCDFAITSEISFNYLQNKFQENGKKIFDKSPKTRFLYEKGSVFINPTDKLLENLNKPNLQKIGLNIGSLK